MPQTNAASHEPLAASSAVAVMRYVETVMLIHFQRASLMVLRDWESGRMRIDMRSAIELELVRSKCCSIKDGGTLLHVLDHTCTRIGKHGLISEILSPVCDVVSVLPLIEFAPCLIQLVTAASMWLIER